MTSLMTANRNHRLTTVGLVRQVGAVWESVTDHTGFDAHVTTRTLPERSFHTAW